MVTGGENDAFLGGGGGKPTKGGGRGGCLRSKGCLACAVVTGIFGLLFVMFGLVALFAGEGMLRGFILKSMALTPGGDVTASWLEPPVTPHLSGYAFHVTNPNEVLNGAKPVLEERGPYVYKSVTVKDTDNNMYWSDGEEKLTYRPRKFYSFEPSLSGPGLDPKTDVLTVPNIPLWTGLNAIRSESGVAKNIGRDMVTGNGRGTPFIEVTFDGLLWGYEDELPCLKMDRPSGCGGEDDPFGDDGGDAWGDDEWKRRRKRSVSKEDFESRWSNPDQDKESEYYGQAKPKAEFVDCKCNWGLFRDRNVTMRKPIRIHTGVADLGLKGVVEEFDGANTLGWWKEGSQCDAVGGQDSSTLPPGLTKESTPNIFISLMCRGLPMEFEKVSGGKKFSRFFSGVFCGERSLQRCRIFRAPSVVAWNTGKLLSSRDFLFTLKYVTNGFPGNFSIMHHPRGCSINNSRFGTY